MSAPSAEGWPPSPLPQRRPSPAWHRAMGLGLHSVSPHSPQRQPHTASSVSQAFKLPFYLNLCPRIWAEKGPFQSQFLLYGFTGDHIGQLLEISRCSQHSRGARGSHRLWLFPGRGPTSQPELLLPTLAAA